MAQTDENLFSRFVERFPTETATVLLETPTGQRYSYADALAASGRLASYISKLGLRAGDRVTVQVPKSPEALWLYLACLRAGLVYQPLNDAYGKEEIAYFIGNAEPSLIVCDPANQALIADLPKTRDCPVRTLGTNADGSLIEASRLCAPEFETTARNHEDLAVLLYSSGTTGKPKGAMLTHGNLLSNVESMIPIAFLEPDDILLSWLPYSHVYARLTDNYLATGAGITVALAGSIDTLLDDLDAVKPTWLTAVPVSYPHLRAHETDS